MAVNVNFIVAKNNPNLYAAAKAANLPREQVSQLEQFSWTVDKNKKLNLLNDDVARKEYNELDPEIQEKLKYLYPRAAYMQAPPDASDYALGALKTVGTVLASPLIGVFKAAGSYNRIINTPYLVARQVTQGEGLFSMQTWTDAWDGRRIFDHGALTEAINYFGNDKIEVAKGFLAGKTPGEIIAASGGAVNQKLLDALEESLNNPEEFQQVMDAVKYAQVSPGRDISRAFFKKDPNSSTAVGDYVDGKTRNVSGKIDFFYQLAIDPLTWFTGGLTAAARAGTRAIKTMENNPGFVDGANIGVAKVFADERNGVRKLWDEQLGPKVAKLIDAKKLENRVAQKSITDDIKLRHPAYNNDAALNVLVENGIVDASKAKEYFEKAENLGHFMAGRIDGVQYYRNGIATANQHRRAAILLSNLTEKFINPKLFNSKEEMLQTLDDMAESLRLNGPENGYVQAEITDIKKFHDSLTRKQKFQIGLQRQLTRSAQGSVTKLGTDAIKTANSFRLTARQVLPKDMAEFLTMKFISSTTADQIAISKSLDYAIIERYGITGHPGGKDLAAKIINDKYGVAKSTDETADLAIREDVAQTLPKTLVTYRSGVPYLKTGTVIQPYQETGALGAIDYFMLSELSYAAKNKKNLLLSISGVTSSKTAGTLVNNWSLFTLFPRLGIRSAIDETFLYILTAPAKNIFEALMPRIVRGNKLFPYVASKGTVASNIGNSFSGSKSGEKLRQLIARKFNFSTPSQSLNIKSRLEHIEDYAKDLGIPVSELTSDQRKFAQALGAVEMYGNDLFSKLNPAEAYYLMEAFAFNSQFLGSTTRSVSSAANISGKQSSDITNELSNQLLEQNQFDLLINYLQKSYKAKTGPRVEIGRKGREVDAEELVRDNILNGLGVNAIHFENFIKRFYGNTKIIYGDSDNYILNQGEVFLKNNALRDTKDWYNASNALLRQIGVERNVEGVFDDVTQLTLDELNGKFLFSIRDRKALRSFLDSRSYTSALRAQGMDDIDIARHAITSILADTYRYFHGDSNKFNQKLFDKIKTEHDKITTFGGGSKGILGGNAGKGTPLGDAKDIAMRSESDFAIVELQDVNIQKSIITSDVNAIGKTSSETSLRKLGPATGNLSDKTIMLARNGKLANQELRPETINSITKAVKDGARFVVGDMPGVDSQFHKLLKELNADYIVYHTGSQPRTGVILKTEKFISNSWRKATQKISFDDFSDLTKGFQPTGKMYTSLEIEGLADFGTAFQRLGNNLMEIMDHQVTAIIRQPAVMIAYLKLRKFYSKAEKQMSDDLLKQAELDASFNNRPFNKAVEEEKTIGQSAKYFTELSIQQATDDVLKFVDNPNIRSNFAVSARNVGRYYRATEDFQRRVLRLGDVPARVIYRARLMHLGLDAAGGVYEDQRGDLYIMMPMDDIIFKTIDSVVRTLTPGEAGFGQPIFNDFTMKLKLGNPSFSPDAGLPTLSGPIAALSVLAMKSVLGQVGGNLGKKTAQELDNFALGTIGENMDFVKSVVPSSLLKLYSIIPQNEKNRQEATAAMQAIAYNASQGYMLDPNATEQEKFTYLKNIRLSAHNIVVMRSILGLISPIAPSMQESINVPDYLKEVGITGLRPEFFDILNAVTQKYKGDIQDPYELAVATFVGKNPGKLIYTVSRDDKKTNVIINKTKELKNWAIENEDNIKIYGESAFIFAPNTGDFDVSTYAWLEGAGLIGNKDLETYYRDVLVSRDKQAYYNIGKEEKAFLATSGDTMARKGFIESSTRQRSILKASNPLLEPALTGGGNEISSELASLSSIEQIIIDDKITVDPGTKQRLAMVSSRIRRFVSFSNDPSNRELSNFSQIKRELKQDIEALINDLQDGDPILKEANRAVFKSILNYYSRDTYTARERF